MASPARFLDLDGTLVLTYPAYSRVISAHGVSGDDAALLVKFPGEDETGSGRQDRVE